MSITKSYVPTFLMMSKLLTEVARLGHCDQCMLSHFSCVQLYTTLWTVACQASLSMGSSRQEYWCGLPCPSRGDLPNLGIEPVSPVSPALQVDSLPLSHLGSPVASHMLHYNYLRASL